MQKKGSSGGGTSGGRKGTKTDSGAAAGAAQRKIWAPGVRSGKRDLGVRGDGLQPDRSSPAAEMARWRKVKKLRNKLHQLCAKAGKPVPLLAFERWQCTCKLRESLACGRERVVDEPLLPAQSDHVDEGLVHDLVRGGMCQDAAEQISQKMASYSATYATEISEISGRSAADLERDVEAPGEPAQAGKKRKLLDGGGRPGDKQVVARVLGGVVDLFWGGVEEKPYMRISRAHLEKLRILFERHGGRRAEDGGQDGSLGMGQEFLRAALCVLLRYDALGGHGYQAALAEGAFDTLLSQLNCQQECFASPFNCRYDRYCSAFGDVDASFGSLGSFFSPRFAPTRGCFEANPPFVPILMQHMVDKMESLLAAASASGGEAAGGVGGGGLTFVVIVPAWTQLPFWKALEESSWLRAPVLQVPAAEHGFCDGAQHQRKPSERHRPSSFDTGVFILQNDAAHVRTSAASLARILSQLRDDMGKAQGGLRDIAAYEARVRKTDEISKAVGEGVDKAKKRRRREGGAGGQG